MTKLKFKRYIFFPPLIYFNPFKGILNDAKIQLPSMQLTEIGNTKGDGEGNITQPIIVQFTSFRARTVLYKARKSIKNKFKYGVSLDLTTTRLSLLNLGK